jgi:hypothetical protein
MALRRLVAFRQLMALRRLVAFRQLMAYLGIE